VTGHPHQPALLFHYTCIHAAADIRRTGEVRPGAMLGIDRKKLRGMTVEEQRAVLDIRSFAWFTDLAPPAPKGPLGLTMHSIQCDRTEFCFQVEPDWDQVRWWMHVRREHPDLLQLEAEPRSLPMHWFVSEKPVAVYREWDARRGAPICPSPR
jgi:hypothetical protein